MKRRAFKLVLFLLAGAIINVAVAWGCTVYFGTHGVLSPGLRSTSFGVDLLSPSYTHRFEPMLRTHGWKPRSTDPTMVEYTGEYLLYATKWPALGIVRIAFEEHRRIDSPLSFDPGHYAFAFRTEAGWPRLAIGGWQWMEPSTGWEARGAVALGRRTIPQSSVLARVLPLHPIWPGFAINTIFYAAILYALFAVPGAVRRRVRKRRGQCASCGYSLQGHGTSGGAGR
jgi:hypothetical protein